MNPQRRPEQKPLQHQEQLLQNRPRQLPTRQVLERHQERQQLQVLLCLRVHHRLTRLKPLPPLLASLQHLALLKDQEQPQPLEQHKHREPRQPRE